MDDYTWNMKLKRREIRQKQHDRLLFCLIALLAVMIGGWLWYSLSYTRTPEYALKQLQSAVNRRDSGTFHRYINLDLLTSMAYDDLTVDLFSYDSSLTPETKKLFEKFYVLVKPQLTQGTADTILRRVSSGGWELPDGADILKGRQLGIDYERFLECAQLRNTELVKLGTIQKDGRSATAEMTVRDTYTQTEFTLQLVMEQSEEGYWQVAYIKNYREYLETIAPLHNKDIADYIHATQSIVNQYNTKFQQQQNRFHTLTTTSDGRLSRAQKSAIQSLLEDQVIPTLTERQQKLDLITVPPGASYLSQLRKDSTQLTIDAWKHFTSGINKGDQSELETAETLHKRELEVDLRIEDIIKHAAVSKNIPNIP